MQLKTIHRRKRKYFLLILLLSAVGMTNAQAQVSTWDGSWEPWTIGNGTEDDPFIIENAQQLAYLAYRVNNGEDANGSHISNSNYHYKLMVDLDLNGSENFQWTPIGYWNSDSDYQCFGGHFDGNGHTIENLYINSEANRVGLFGFINGGEIRNIVINSGFVSTTGNQAGGIVGCVMGSISVDNCQNNMNVISNGSSGGIVGFIQGATSISNSLLSTKKSI